MFKRSPVTDRSTIETLGPLEDLGFFRESELLPLIPSDDFSADIAWWMAELSRLAYVTTKTKVTKTLRDAGFKSPKYFSDEKAGTFAFVAHTDDMVIVVFRGTEITSFADIKTDLNIFLTNENEELRTRVHGGFKAGLDVIWDDLLVEIKKRHTDKRCVYFTGHSLGAALATLAVSRTQECDKVYAFGSPRVGNSKFAESTDADIYRISRAHDIVTRIPPMFIGYRHVGDDYFITNDGDLIKNPSFARKLKERLGGSELKILLFMVLLIFTRNPLSFIMSYLLDHSPYNYSVFMWNNSSINQK